MYTILQLMEMLIFENWHYFILKHANELQNLVDRKQSSDISLPVTLQTGYRSRQGRILACANWGPSIDQSWGLIQPPALVDGGPMPRLIISARSSLPWTSGRGGGVFTEILNF